MKTALKKTQVDGEKYLLPDEEVEVQKLIKKGLTLERRIKTLADELGDIKGRLTEIAEARRGDNTTVKLTGISGESLVTFRESYEAGPDVEDIGQDLGTLFGRFFEKKVKFKTTKELKQFMNGGADFGFEDPDAVRGLIERHVTLKTIKPNVKLTAAE